jgi:hypothetical protein
MSRCGCRHGLVPTSRHGVAWRYNANRGGTVGTVVFCQQSCVSWSRRGFRHRLLISWGRRTGVGSRPHAVDRLAAYGVDGHDPVLWGHGSRWLSWP